MAATPEFQDYTTGAYLRGAGQNYSFSGCDMRAYVAATDPHTGKQSGPKLLGNIATLSYSIHREKFPVRTLGTTYPKAFTRGPRTIAGTMIFNVFDRYALWDILDTKLSIDRGMNEDAHMLLGDQIAPFDITCTYTNELGIYSQMKLIGVELVDEGQVNSVNDIYIESTHSFIAADIVMMVPGNAQVPTTTATAPYNSSSYFNGSNQTVTSDANLPNPLTPTVV